VWRQVGGTREEKLRFRLPMDIQDEAMAGLTASWIVAGPGADDFQDDLAGALEDGEPLSLHGARRGLGETLYRQSPVAAQEQLRHKSIETTKESYSHIEASKQADVVSELLDRRS